MTSCYSMFWNFFGPEQKLVHGAAMPILVGLRPLLLRGSRSRDSVARAAWNRSH
jgi:hypothetical protein